MNPLEKIILEAETEFDEQFCVLANGVSSNDGKRYIDILVDKNIKPATDKQIKSFLRSQLLKLVEGMREEIDEKPEEYLDGDRVVRVEKLLSYLDEIISKYKK